MSAARSELMPATMKCWFAERGFGFVTLADRRDIFVHARTLEYAGLPPEPGARRESVVDFEAQPDGRLRVTRIEAE